MAKIHIDSASGSSVRWWRNITYINDSDNYQVVSKVDTDSRISIWANIDWLQIWPVWYWLGKNLSGALLKFAVDYIFK